MPDQHPRVCLRPYAIIADRASAWQTIPKAIYRSGELNNA